MSAKMKRRIFDILVVAFIVIFFLLGMRQNQDATYIFSLTALALSGFNVYFSLYRPKYLLKPILFFEYNVQPSPPTQDEQRSGTKSSWFLRLKIVNKGLTPANKCVGRLIEVRDTPISLGAVWRPQIGKYSRADTAKSALIPARIAQLFELNTCQP